MSPSQDAVTRPVSPGTSVSASDAEQYGLMSSGRVSTVSISTIREDGADNPYQDPIWSTTSPEETTPKAGTPRRRSSADLGASPLSDSHADARSIEKGPTIHEAPAPTTAAPPGRPRAPPQTWWWWEIGACSLSIVSTILLVALLLRVENIALDSWSWPIRINSVIAVLTAIARTAMVVPLAACISQLKWRHFEQPNRLSHLQDYDNASRGPWGSLRMLFNVQTGDLLAWTLALWTVLSLGISPSAQQILEFPTRRAKLDNVKATIAQASSYWAKEQFEMHPSAVSGETEAGRYFFPPDVALPFQIKLRSGLLGLSFAPDFSCPQPATECEWVNFSTLGLCADVRNVTSDTVVSCELEDSGEHVVCEYAHGRNKNSGTPRSVRMMFRNDAAKEAPTPSIRTLSSNQTTRTRDSPSPSGPTPDLITVAGQSSSGDSAMAKRQEFKLLKADSLQTSNGGLAARIRGDVFDKRMLNIKSDTKIEKGRPPPVDVFEYSWQWCEKTLVRVSTKGGKLHIGKIQTKPLPTEATEGEIISVHGGSDGNAKVYSGSTTETKYRVGQVSDARLRLIQKLFFDQEVSSRSGGNDSNAMDGLLDFGMFVYESDFTGLVRSHATTVDNMVHSWGSNANATSHEGAAYMTETYVRVRWAWIALPTVEAAGVAVLLALSIALTRHRPLLKDSALALLFYGPGRDGLPDRGGIAVPGGRSWEGADAGVIREHAKGLIASIERDREGRPGLVTDVGQIGR